MMDLATKERRRWISQLVDATDRGLPNDYQGVLERVPDAINRCGRRYLFHPANSPRKGSYDLRTGYAIDGGQ